VIRGEVGFALSVPADAAAWSGGEATEGGPGREELPVGEAAFTAGFQEHYAVDRPRFCGHSV